MSDFEEYVAGRGPALVAFAVVVTGRDDDGVRLVHHALGRVLAGWEGLVHDEDPDAHLRRDVVAEAARHRRGPRRGGADRAPRTSDAGGPVDPAHDDGWRRWQRWQRLPVLTRAVLALRVLEDRPWAEVAWVTDLSERAARRRAEQGLAALGEDGSTLTEALRARTAGVEALPVELSSRAARVSTRRRERAVRHGALALLLAAVGVPLLVSLWPATTGGLDLDPSPDGSTLQEVLPEDFRTESWRGVELGVPDAWVRGPLAGWCRDDDQPTPRVERPGPGVGREECDPALAPGVQFRLAGDPAPDVPDDLEVRERTLDGRVVLVATPEADLAEQVLATVRTVERTDSAGCAVQRAIPRAGKNFPAVETGSVALSVCRYEVGVSGPNLVQSERLSVIDSLDARRAVDAAPTVVAPQGCLDGPGEEAVALTTVDGDVAWIHLGRCQGLDDEGTHLLSPDVLFWALSPGWDGPRQDLPLPDELRGLPAS